MARKFDTNVSEKRVGGVALGDVIAKIANQYGVGEKLVEARIISSWEDIVGKMVARHTKNLYVRKSKLFLIIDSPTVKNEMLYCKSDILKNVREKSESTLIEEIVFL